MRWIVALLAAAPAWGQVVISQVYGGGGNTGATWRNDFVELFHRGDVAVDLTGWRVEYGPAAADTWEGKVLGGSLAPGQYYLVQESAGAGGTTALPPPDAPGSVLMSATSGKVRLLNAAGAVVDLVGYGAANLAEGTPAPALTNTTAALRRGGGCVDTDNNSADFTTGAPNPRNSSAPRQVCGAAPGPRPARIYEIQGSGPVSPMVGQTVTSSGVVTALKRNGFFLQTPDGETDGDDRTSEGLFVFTSTTPPATIARGNLVQVSGRVTEFRPASDLASPPLTELTDPTVELLSTGASLPQPVRLRAGDWDLERYEGMRVAVPSLTVVGPTGGTVNERNATSTSNGVFYGVMAGGRPFREPGRDWDGNPERLRVESSVEVTAGAVVTGPVGPLDYAFRTYSVLPDSPPAVSGLGAARAAPPAADGEFTVASFNLQRFFGEPTLTASAFQNRLNKASLTIRNVLGAPDILGVEEVENLAVLQALADRLGYRAYLEEGNDPSGIDVGFLVKPGVRVVDVRQEGKNDPNNDRPPLVLRAAIGASAFPLTVVVNHLRSLTDIEDERVQAKRRAQAQFLADLVRSRPGENVIVLGDFNSFQFDDGYVDVIGILQSAAGLINLVDTLPMDQNYSYVFDGNTQTLDHILISRSLAGRVSRFAYGRSNADFPESFRNDPNRPERVSDHDPPVAYFSLASGTPRITPAGVTNAATYLSGAVAPGEIVTVFGAGIGPANAAGLQLTADRRFVATTLAGVRVLFDGFPAPVLYARVDQVNTVAPFGLSGKNATEVQVEFQGQRSNRITVPVTSASPGIFAILNQDFSLNGAANPADPGSVMQIYATGGGPPGEDGRVATGDPPRLQLPVSVRIDGLEAEVLYAGAAPGLVAGVVQVNARVPLGARRGAAPVALAIGSSSSRLDAALR